MKTLGGLVLALLSLGACMGKTQFYGEPKYPGGAQGCFVTCQNQDMEMSGFVYTGEFASSCVCRPRPAPQPPAPAAAPAPDPNQPQSQAELDATAATSAVVGVAVQTQEDDEATAKKHRDGKPAK